MLIVCVHNVLYKDVVHLCRYKLYQRLRIQNLKELSTLHVIISTAIKNSVLFKEI